MKQTFLSLWLIIGLLAAPPLLAQTDSTQTSSTEELNFDEFGDADDKKVRTFCTQKVLYLSPTKLISVGYEGQGSFDLAAYGAHDNTTALREQEAPVRGYRGLRLGFNSPVISRSSFILNLGLTYWNTGLRDLQTERSRFFNALDHGLRSTGINATVFKPLDNRHFLIFQASADVNGNYRRLDELNIGKSTTYSGTAIYGWKPDDNFMWGLGLTRTYRAGQLLHIPVLFYNRTFNQKWGVEAIFPARVNLRRSFGTQSLLMLGYEIEGNAYYLGRVNDSDLFVRRGELKPRITFERQLSGFVWLSAQLGYRYNWRFDAFATQNPARNEKPIFENRLGNPLYFNVSLNLVSP
ncbi:DUF6268 family outer membrane beta-barrel protein [Tellurirhabdus rosea]|uniref:DUF6268 family outer membrane beta-barrel protein n=1 Tax=Tellurirhabdus rosea TaxID=2674997 RepID=UPI00225479E0|nr:DUF6268 family outer membrane beta-barrel protein [Tellurirhabdus rosea]